MSATPTTDSIFSGALPWLVGALVSAVAFIVGSRYTAKAARERADSAMAATEKLTDALTAATLALTTLQADVHGLTETIGMLRTELADVQKDLVNVRVDVAGLPCNSCNSR